MFFKYFKRKKLLKQLQENINHFSKYKYFDISLSNISESTKYNIYSNAFGFNNYIDLVNLIKSDPYNLKLSFLEDNLFNKNKLISNIKNYNKLNYKAIFKEYLINNPEILEKITLINSQDYEKEYLYDLLELYLDENHLILEQNFIEFNELDFYFNINKEKQTFFSYVITSDFDNNILKFKNFLINKNITTIHLKNDNSLNTFSEDNIKYGDYNQFNICENVFSLIETHGINLMSTPLSSSYINIIDNSETKQYLFFLIEDLDYVSYRNIYCFDKLRSLKLSFVLKYDKNKIYSEEISNYIKDNYIHINDFEKDFILTQNPICR